MEKEIIGFLEIDHIRHKQVQCLAYGIQKRVELARASRLLRDVGDGVVGHWQDAIHRPCLSGQRRGALHRCGLPQPQVLEDAPHHGRVVDQREDAHRAVTFRTFERIGFVDLYDGYAMAHVSIRELKMAHWGADGRLKAEAPIHSPFMRRKQTLALK